MKRGLTLGALVVCVFVVVSAVMARLMPSPMKESDYMVIGSVATLVSLGVVFAVLVSTTMKSGDIFFKKRRK
jgi:hypothetical protein